MSMPGCACPLLWFTGSVTVGLGLGTLVGRSVRRRWRVHQWTPRQRSLRVAALMLGLAVLEWFPRVFQWLSHSPLPAGPDWFLDSLILGFITATTILFWPDVVVAARRLRRRE